MTDASVTTLTPSDHTYLYLDTESSPMHWAMLLELSADGAQVNIGDVRDRVRERSELFELFRLGIDGGRWRRPREVVAEKVDVDRHLAAAEYADAAELRQRVTALLETPLPRPQPMWHITLFTPAGDGSQYFMLRVHHAVSDGIAGAAFAALLADGTPEELAGFERFATSPRFRTPEIEPEVLKEAKAAFAAQHAAGKSGRNWPKLTTSGRREYALYSASTRDVRRAAKAHGASVHEFLLAAIGRAISIAPPGSEPAEIIRVTLPVTNDPQFRHTGNAVIVTPLNLAGNETDLGRQLERCKSELAIVEKRRPELASAAPAREPGLPWVLRRITGGAAMKYMGPDIHVGINPGFSRARSVLGTPIVELSALSPLVGYSFSVTSLILGNRTSFGVVADPVSLPEGYADTFVKHFGQVLREA
ncbi:wax ester/triacylglycerol synthase domain-containing protein [Nocardia flavorosea]|uniref:Diacylglycerol O-acyltransferase n=1 Tax=Nocardia flavorosea TaxID=53429 RepID=A0A846YBG2_9NOCA|nr:wax ester/triacylglycerol synthase domain-containing protein [Nocardia flavorosea]NKY55111.1 diacylglycerol O-acyltransferase [Nocardia flavorosea]